MFPRFPVALASPCRFPISRKSARDRSWCSCASRRRLLSTSSCCLRRTSLATSSAEIELTGDRLEQVTKKLVAAGAKARWGSWKDVPQAEQRCARDFTQPVRYGDNENNLWAVYNRAQESFIKGVRRRSSLTGHWNRKIRPVNDLHLKSKVNQALWTAAEEAYLAG